LKHIHIHLSCLLNKPRCIVADASDEVGAALALIPDDDDEELLELAKKNRAERMKVRFSACFSEPTCCVAL
jgi:hypothetical protein